MLTGILIIIMYWLIAAFSIILYFNFIITMITDILIILCIDFFEIILGNFSHNVYSDTYVFMYWLLWGNFREFLPQCLQVYLWSSCIEFLHHFLILILHFNLIITMITGILIYSYIDFFGIPLGNFC